MIPDDVFALAGAGDPRISPDGTTVAYVVWDVDRQANDYRSAIWLIPSDGSSPPTKISAGVKRDEHPCWSPDSSRLAFTSTRDKEAPQLYVLPRSGGEATKLTDLEEDVVDVAWSPDGTQIAFAARERDASYEEEDEKRRPPRRVTRLQYKLDNVGWIGDRRQHIFSVAPEGSSAPVQLTKGDYEDGKPAWSPDSSKIAFVSGRHDDWDVDPRVDLFVIDRSGGEPDRIAGGDGTIHAASFSPDGSKIAFSYTPDVWSEPHHGQIAVADASGGGMRLLTASLDRNCAPYPLLREPTWDDDSIVFAVEDHGDTHLYRVAADGRSEPEVVAEGAISVAGWDHLGDRIVYSAATPSTLSEIYVDETKVTDVSSDFFESREAALPERFVATSKDGAEVEAWIIRPIGWEKGKRYPVLLSVHGGPFTQYANKFFDEFQIYANAGYAVVYANPRGSSGYSEEWGRAIRGPVEGGPGWGTVDYEDVMAVVEHAVATFDFCDGDRVGILGGSYGGFMTSWAVSHTDRFKAACSERAVNNFISEFGSSDIGWWFKAYVGAAAYEDPETYLKLSPSTYAANINTPLLIMHSENDLRCNVEQGENLFTALRLLKRDVEMVRFPGEGHELSRSGSPLHRKQRFEIILEFFAKHLHPDAES
jgi:dipeptidyl aminopeptidase/acylaminoacyl peptidase